MEIIGYCLAVLVGISLGLIGSGGSILTVPILVYLFSISPDIATTYSLCIVGVSACIGSIQHYKQGNLKLQTALIFGLPALISLLTIRKLVLPQLPHSIFTLGNIVITKNMLLMVVFAVLMIAASTSMIRTTTSNTLKQKPNIFQLIIYGFAVGIVTGFLGAGGGFLIIPALVFLGNLEMKQAIGTSLAIIACNALIGFSGDLMNGVSIHYTLLITFCILSILGIFMGTYLSKKIDGKTLKPIFGWFVLVMGIYIITRELGIL